MQYRILIIEDDIVTAELNAISLQKMGLFVHVVNQGNLAIQEMKKWKPHAVVLDLELPGQNGVEILHEMNLDAELRNTIVIAHTIHNNANDSLGFAFFAQYQRTKNEEPMIIEKVEKAMGGWLNLRYALAKRLGEKFGSIPKALSDWIESTPPTN